MSGTTGGEAAGLPDLLAALNSRLHHFQEGAVPDAVGVEALIEAATLFERILTSSPDKPVFDMPILRTVAMLHLARHNALTGGFDSLDLRISVAIFMLVAIETPELVPAPVRELIEKNSGFREAAPPNPASLYAFMLWPLVRQQRKQRLDLMNAAISLLAAVRVRLFSDDADRPIILATLGESLLFRFHQRGNLADLTGSADVLRQAVVESSNKMEYSDFHGGILSSLAIALAVRFEHTADIGDITEAIKYLRQVTGQNLRDAEPSDIHGLGTALLSLYKHTNEQSQLEEAISLLRRAARRVSKTDIQRGVYLNTLGLALLHRFRRERKRSDLGKSLRYFRKAAAATSSDTPERSGYLSNIALALTERARKASEATDESDAMAALVDATSSTPEDHPYRAWLLFKLGGMRADRFSKSGELSELTEAFKLFRAAATSTAGPRQIRMAAALKWTSSAADQCDWTEATEGATSIVELLPDMAWRGLDRESQERQLAEMGPIPTWAAACALSAQQPQRAIELLEHGRSVLWSQALHARDEFTELAQVAPALHRRLRDAARELEVHRPDPSSADGRMMAASEWDSIVDEVRRLPNFEYFLRVQPLSDLHVDEIEHPVVVLNMSSYRSDAIILRRGTLDVLELPQLTDEDAVNHTNSYMRALLTLDLADRHDTSGKPSDQAFFDLERASAMQTLRTLLEWLWDTITEPVLSYLGYTEQPQNELWPRLWWCPTGPLVRLPLHAAGYHEADEHDSGRTVLDRVVSSYTPTLSSLVKSRSSARSLNSPQRMLVVAMPTTPRLLGGAPLPGARAEADLLEAIFGTDSTLRVGADATRDRVLEDLRSHSLVHFACHGGYDPERPSANALDLYDQQLTTLEIARLELPDAELAFLSACKTGVGGVELAEESIHLAAALQFTGYRHVIATQWTVGDQPSIEVAQMFYKHLSAGNVRFDVTNIAEALHHTIRSMRARYSDEIPKWAFWVHTGA